MTIQEIEQKIGGHYSKAANKERIIKMWELIGDNYRKLSMSNGSVRIIIPDKIYDTIRKQIGYSVIKLVIRDDKGYYVFISTESEAQKFNKVRQEKTTPEKIKTNIQRASYGIYCIQYKGEIIYIGMTQTSFEQRWKEHLQLFKNPKHTEMLLYHSNLNPEELEFRVMVDLTKEKANRELTTRDIKAMEMGLIACFKPRFNVSGVKIPYRFD